MGAASGTPSKSNLLGPTGCVRPRALASGSGGSIASSPVKDAWRPFELGPRNFLGQGIAMLEVRAEAAYDEWDLKHPKEGPQDCQRR